MRAAAPLVALLLLFAPACGSDDSLAPQTPGPPAGAPIPEAPEAPGGSDDSTNDEDSGGGNADGESTPTPTAAPDDSGAAQPPPETAAAPDTSGGGAAAPTAEPDSPANDTPPEPGSDAEQFEDFCTQNPGAC